MERNPETNSSSSAGPAQVQLKRPFDIEMMLARIEHAVEPYPKAMLFDLADRGYDSPFEQLVACLISVRTLDEVSLPSALRLLTKARTPQEFSRLPASQIDELIKPATYHSQKASRLKTISNIVVEEYQGRLPCDYEHLSSLPGVGPKCANLVLGIACGQPRVGVDIHVHRVSNRWGYIQAPTPEKSMVALLQKLPKAYWVKINALLVPFGKHVCKGLKPMCSVCPVEEFCHQVGVTDPT